MDGTLLWIIFGKLLQTLCDILIHKTQRDIKLVLLNTFIMYCDNIYVSFRPYYFS